MLFVGLFMSIINADTLDKYKNIEDQAIKNAKDMNLSGAIKKLDTTKYIKNIDKIYNNMKPNIEKAKETMFNGDYTVTRKAMIKRIKAIHKVDLTSFFAKNRIYVFMSSSVPKSVWYNYGSYIYNNKIKNASMLLRGCIGGCKKISPTIQFINSILKYKEHKRINPSILIDTLLFRKYNIQEAPCFVYAKDVKVIDPKLSEGLDKNVKVGTVYKSCGDWSFKYHIEELYRQSNDKDLKKLLERL